MIRYLSYADMLREDAGRHMERGAGYIVRGRGDWAEGSFRKAFRKLRQADAEDARRAAFQNDTSLQGTIIRMLAERAAEEMEVIIIDGRSR